MPRNDTARFASQLGTALVLCWLVACAPASPPVAEPAATTFDSVTLQIASGDTVETVSGAQVSLAFFDSKMAVPMLGRTFVEADYGTDGAKVAMVSNTFWENVLEERPDAVGKILTVNGEPVTIVGVFAKGFAIPPGTMVWLPRQMSPDMR